MSNAAKICFLLFPLLACHSRDSGQSATGRNAVFENVETGSKSSYAAGPAQLGSGVWQLSDALIGRSQQDVKNGSAALRLKPGGVAETGFAIATQSAEGAVRYADYGDDQGAALAVFYSTDGGARWQLAGKDGRGGHSLRRFSFKIPAQKNLRLRFANTGKGRMNLDDFEVAGKATPGAASPSAATTATTTPVAPTATTQPQTAGRDDNMALGNPSGAAKGKDNYLMAKPQYALSYNNSKGSANWVSWHLSTAWMGSADRCNCFAPDAELPAGFFKALPSHYLSSGFDRGHLCPSADRSANDADNAATFLMSNMTPQSPHLNQQTWNRLEDYCRKLAERGMELYIIAGGYGAGGTGSNGDANAIGGGKIQVPAHCWKIIVVLPQGDNDLQRITAATRVIAVDMPNVPEVNARTWNFYQTTVSAIEQATGYRFFSNLPPAVQAALKQKQDGQR